MVITNNSITDKNYKKLSIQVALNGLSFCCHDLLTQNIYSIKHIDFKNYPSSNSLENNLWQAFMDHKELTASYDEVKIIHDNNLFSLVPKVVFDEKNMGSYLQYNIKIFESDFFVYDEIENHDIINVYVPFVNINNFLIDQFGSFEYYHSFSVLIKKLLNGSVYDTAQNMYAHISRNRFEIIIIQNKKLVFFNSFDYQTPEDFLYYLLFTAEQLQLNPEEFPLYLLGNIHIEDPLFKMAYKYIRNVQLMNTKDCEAVNAMTAESNRLYFTLFNS